MGVIYLGRQPLLNLIGEGTPLMAGTLSELPKHYYFLCKQYQEIYHFGDYYVFFSSLGGLNV